MTLTTSAPSVQIHCRESSHATKHGDFIMFDHNHLVGSPWEVSLSENEIASAWVCAYELAMTTRAEQHDLPDAVLGTTSHKLQSFAMLLYILAIANQDSRCRYIHIRSSLLEHCDETSSRRVAAQIQAFSSDGCPGTAIQMPT